MATVEVSTWAELKAALQGGANGNTIKLTADIDMNEVAPTGDTISVTYNANVIDGNGHAIKNLRTRVSNPVPIFDTQFSASDFTFTIKNINFVNLILAGASLVGKSTGSGYTAATTIFENVRIVGSRSGAAYLFTYNTGVTLNRCFIFIPWQGSGQSDLSYTSLIPKSTSNVTAVANYCWFREKYTGWLYNITTEKYYPNASSANDLIPSFSFSMFKLNGCYIDGSMKIPAGYDAVGGGRKYVYYCELIAKAVNNAYTPSAQNVFDCDLIAELGPVTLTDNTIRTCGWSGVIKKNAQTTGGVAISSYTFPSGSSMGGSVTPIFASPTEMKDASWLSTAGFDIIVPSE